MIPEISQILQLFGIGNSHTSKIVIKKLTIDESLDDMIFISGRKPGILSWIMSMIGIEPTVSLVCSRDTILFQYTSISRKAKVNVPLRSVTAIESEVSKPIRFLVYAALTLFASHKLAGMLFMYASVIKGWGYLIAAVFVVLYFLGKTVGVHISNGGDARIGLFFSGSLMENITVDESKANAIVDIVTRALLNKALVTRTDLL